MEQALSILGGMAVGIVVALPIEMAMLYIKQRATQLRYARARSYEIPRDAIVTWEGPADDDEDEEVATEWIVYGKE